MDVIVEVYASKQGTVQPKGVITNYDCFRLLGILTIAACKYRQTIPVTFDQELIVDYVFGGSERQYIFLCSATSTNDLTCFDQLIYGFALAKIISPTELHIILIEMRPGFGETMIKQVVKTVKQVFSNYKCFNRDDLAFNCKTISLGAINNAKVLNFYKTLSFKSDTRTSNKQRNKMAKVGLIPLKLDID